MDPSCIQQMSHTRISIGIYQEVFGEDKQKFSAYSLQTVKKLTLVKSLEWGTWKNHQYLVAMDIRYILDFWTSRFVNVWVSGCNRYHIEISTCSQSVLIIRYNEKQKEEIYGPTGNGFSDWVKKWPLGVLDVKYLQESLQVRLAPVVFGDIKGISDN